jgi:hypothetical protein
MRRPNPHEIYRTLEANASPNFYKWQVINYRQMQPNELTKYIFSGDVIRLKHAETSGYLCFDELSVTKLN